MLSDAAPQEWEQCVLHQTVYEIQDIIISVSLFCDVYAEHKMNGKMHTHFLPQNICNVELPLISQHSQPTALQHHKDYLA